MLFHDHRHHHHRGHHACYHNHHIKRILFSLIFIFTGRVVSGYRVRDGKWTEIGRKDPQLPQVEINK